MALLPVLLMAGCADSVSDGGSVKRFTEMIRSYDHTLTKSEKEAAISELQKEKERQEQQVGQTVGTPKTN